MAQATALFKKKSSSVPYFVQIMSWITLIWLVLLGVTLGLTLRYSISTLEEKIDEILQSTVITLAESDQVHKALEEGRCEESLMDYLDSVVDNTTDLDVITIADENALRIYHINRERIGEKFVGGDEGPVLEGQRYFSNATGTMGYQHRYFSPVLDEGGSIIGFVMASTTQLRMQQLYRDISKTYLNLMGLLSVCTLILSALLAVYLRNTLRGAKPEELVRTYLTQNDILNSLEEGLISLDLDGRIRLVNEAAEKTLGIREELLLYQNVDEVLRDNNGVSLRGVSGENLLSSHPNLMVRSILLKSGSSWARQVLILNDKTEAFRRAEQLNGTRHIVSTLRANNHEFMNRLQVISGLLQMGRIQEVMGYIGEISATHAQVIAPVMQLIHNSNVAALILGKMSTLRELDIQMTLLTNSYLPEHSVFLTSDELVSVVGNLLENAIEAVNMVSDNRSRTIDLQITEDDHGLLILISDSGVGIAPEHIPLIHKAGFSTKAAEGRGVGMSLIMGIVENRGGSLEVDSEPGNGTTFTLIFNKKRGGKEL